MKGHPNFKTFELLGNKRLVKRIIVFAFCVSLFSNTTLLLAAEYWCSPGSASATCAGDGSCDNVCGPNVTHEGQDPVCPVGQLCICDKRSAPSVCSCFPCTGDDRACDAKYREVYGINSPSVCLGPTCTLANGNLTCRPNSCNSDEVLESFLVCADYGAVCCRHQGTPCVTSCSNTCVDDPNPSNGVPECPSGWDVVTPADPNACCSTTKVCCKQGATCPTDSCFTGTNCPENYNQTTDLCQDPNSVCCVEAPLVVPRPPGLVYTGPIIDSLEKIIGPVAKMLYYGGLAIGVLFIILSGYKIMVSEGDPQRVKAAQEQLTSAILGIIFILLSVTIIRIIMNTIVNI